MKILIFSPYYPPHVGGLESHADEFNKYLSAKNIDITVFTPRLPKNAPEKEIKHTNVKIIRFPALEIIPNYPIPKFWRPKFWQLFFDTFKKNFDVTISRTRFFLTSLLALTYSKIKKTTWIHIEHGSDFVQSNNQLISLIAKTYDYTFGRFVLTLADKLVANSQASAQFCQKLKKKECSVIYRGVEIEKINAIPEDTKLRKMYPNDIIITFVGRLIDGKGVKDLIKAISQIKQSNIKCLIIGPGPQKKQLEKLSIDLQIEDKIIFLGQQNHSNAIGILKASDIFVNPSYTEGLPTTVIEAALCKKAIIATNVGGTSEVISKNNDGFLIPPRNARALKNKLEILMENDILRKKFAKNAYTKISKKFNWDNSIKKYEKEFKKLLAKK